MLYAGPCICTNLLTPPRLLFRELTCREYRYMGEGIGICCELRALIRAGLLALP